MAAQVFRSFKLAAPFRADLQAKLLQTTYRVAVMIGGGIEFCRQ